MNIAVNFRCRKTDRPATARGRLMQGWESLLRGRQGFRWLKTKQNLKVHSCIQVRYQNPVHGLWELSSPLIEKHISKAPCSIPNSHVVILIDIDFVSKIFNKLVMDRQYFPDPHLSKSKCSIRFPRISDSQQAPFPNMILVCLGSFPNFRIMVPGMTWSWPRIPNAIKMISCHVHRIVNLKVTS